MLSSNRIAAVRFIICLRLLAAVKIYGNLLRAVKGQRHASRIPERAAPRGHKETVCPVRTSNCLPDVLSSHFHFCTIHRADSGFAELKGLPADLSRKILWGNPKRLYVS